MPELLFEIAVEELPALSIEPAQIFMRSFLIEAFKEMRIAHSDIEAYGTPRRLVVMVKDVALKQKDLEEEIFGPSAQIAFDVSGKLSQAGLGFIKAKGLNESDIYRKKTDKGEVIAAQKRTEGTMTKSHLSSLLIEMMRKIPFKKRMRWEASGETFARPIRGMVCLFNGEYLPIKFADVTANNFSSGHRFMNPEPFLVTSVDDYQREIKARHVVLDSREREAMFLNGAKEKLRVIGGELKVDADLIAIVRNLMEYPYVILGSYEEKYLKIPSEILISEMKSHQKCFAVYNQSGKLLPYFICSAATKPFDEEVFAKGNARVLRARFEDGAFYFAEDQKKRLSEHAHLLSTLIFERELGTVADKARRIEQVALRLLEVLELPESEAIIVKTAAPLVKADLTTGVVGQFPELQGIMGRIYADIEHIPPDVGECIETHYWPRFADDQLPRLKSAAILSIADKLDTLVGIIAIGKRPTGNKDPFALRRAAIGIVRMLVGFGFSIDVEELISLSLTSYGEKFVSKNSAITTEIKDFLMQRARGLLIDDLAKAGKEYAVNFADSVLAVGESNVLDIFARAHTLFAMRIESGEAFESLVQAFKRASNIVKKAESAGERINHDMGEQFLEVPSEKELLRAVLKARALIGRPVDRHIDFAGLRSTYVEIFSQMAQIKPKLDAFFDGVMVMVDEPNLRNARLSLLSEIKRAADRIADFTHL